MTHSIAFKPWLWRLWNSGIFGWTVFIVHWSDILLAYLWLHCFISQFPAVQRGAIWLSYVKKQTNKQTYARLLLGHQPRQNDPKRWEQKYLYTWKLEHETWNMKVKKVTKSYQWVLGLTHVLCCITPPPHPHTPKVSSAEESFDQMPAP